MSTGVDGRVNAIAVVGDEVYVGGDFTIADGTVEASRLTRWDGSAWSAVAGGVSSSQPASPASVRALACDDAKLYIAGAFDSVGSGGGAVAANGLAALDLRAGTWETYDGGLWYGAEPGEGRALALARDRLYVGGSFDRTGGVETASLRRSTSRRAGGRGSAAAFAAVTSSARRPSRARVDADRSRCRDASTSASG